MPPQLLSVLPARVRGDNEIVNACFPPGKRAMVRRCRLSGPRRPRSCGILVGSPALPRASHLRVFTALDVSSKKKKIVKP
eukprot:scaffold1386_cov119-Isochrysis_galbana.AAC.5